MSNPFFTPGAASQVYERTRDSEGLEDLRALLETWWTRYEPFCGDTHFLSDARANLIQRCWELYLGSMLLEAGFRLERDKYRQYQEFRRRGIVAASDPFIVAISGAGIDDADIEHEYPDIVGAVYPVGDVVIHVPIGGEREAWTSVSTRTEIKKASGSPVSTEAFLSDDYAGISMVRFSHRNVWNMRDLADREIIGIHNSRAINPLPLGTFPWGREFWVDGQSELRFEEHRPDRRVSPDEEPG